MGLPGRDPHDWSWLQALLVLALVVVALGGTVGGLTLADYHAPQTNTTVSLDRSAQGVVDANNALAMRLEYRSVSRVYRVTADGDRRHLYTYEDAVDYSDDQFVANYNRHVPNITSYSHYRPLMGALFASAPGSDRHTTLYVHGGYQVVAQTDAPHAVGEYGVPSAGDDPYLRSTRGPTLYDELVFEPFFVNHTADWRVAERSDESVTYALDGRRDYARVRPLLFERAVHENSSVRLTVDRETGRVSRIREVRTVTTPVRPADPPEDREEYWHDHTERVTYVVETNVTDWGAVDVTRPAGIPGRPPKATLFDLLDY